MLIIFVMCGMIKVKNYSPYRVLVKSVLQVFCSIIKESRIFELLGIFIKFRSEIYRCTFCKELDLGRLLTKLVIINCRLLIITL